MAMSRYALLIELGKCITFADSTGVSLFFAARGIVTDLRRVRDLTEIKQVEKEDKMISEGTEDGSLYWSDMMLPTTNDVTALHLDTLLKLSESTSYDLRAAYGYFSLHIPSGRR
jgi:hypothetical protein